jgi:hypothetical protein
MSTSLVPLEILSPEGGSVEELHHHFSAPSALTLLRQSMKTDEVKMSDDEKKCQKI